MTVLVTGCAGFIGYHVADALLKGGDKVVGVDNINDYYDRELKLSRLSRLELHSNFTFLRGDIEDYRFLEGVFSTYTPSSVIHLAAQAGVRYSLANPSAYSRSNLSGFLTVLECCRLYPVALLLYASSSSVYGANTKIPFSETDRTDHPLSLYAATKKANELMAASYRSLFSMRTVGLRFFTVYGPWGRPDMALFKFTRAILAAETIELFSQGEATRDFTYIEDVADITLRVHRRGIDLNLPLEQLPPVLNVGSHSPVPVHKLLSILEKKLGRTANVQLQGPAKGDAYRTFADSDLLEEFIGPTSFNRLEEGVSRFVDWYNSYYSARVDSL